MKKGFAALGTSCHYHQHENSILRNSISKAVRAIVLKGLEVFRVSYWHMWAVLVQCWRLCLCDEANINGWEQGNWTQTMLSLTSPPMQHSL